MTTGGEDIGGSFEAILLAAGSGSRFGGAKLLAPWQGGVLLDGALTAALAAPVRTVTLVTGAHVEGITEAAKLLAGRLGQTDRLKVVHASRFVDGLSASLRAGVAGLPRGTGGVLVFLGDMPLVPHSVAAQLLAALTPDHDAAAPVFEGRRGHPVLIGRALLEPILGLTGDHGAGHLLAGLGPRLARVAVEDAGILRDIDHPADLTGL